MQTRIEGYIARFNDETVIAGEFRERIAPGAFRKTLVEKPDVVMLLDHDTGRVIGRTSAGTLTLAEDREGLRFTLDPDGTTPEGQSAIGTVRRGEVKGASFGFSVRAEEWEDGGRRLPLRTITDLTLFECTITDLTLFECTLTAFPAYPTTSASLRNASDNHANAGRRRAEAAMRRRDIFF